MSDLKAKTIVIKTTESILVIGFIIFEELIWDVFTKPVIKYLKSIKVFESLKDTFLEMNRYALLSVFILILMVAQGLGVLSGLMVINGDPLFGILIYALKIPVAAFVFWLFDLTRDRLLSFSWLKKSYEYTMHLVDQIINSSIHNYIKSLVLSGRKKLRDLSLEYFGDESFTSSVKSHYRFFRSYIKLKLSGKSSSHQV